MATRTSECFALANGAVMRVTVLDGGPVVHEGRGGYFEARTPGPDGVLPADRLLGLLTGVLSAPVPRNLP